MSTYEINGFNIAILDDGRRRLYKYTGNSSEVIIPDDVNIIGSDTFYNYNSSANSHFVFIKKIIIPDSVEKIEEEAFLFLKELEAVRLPNNEKFVIIEDGTFNYCESLKTITIPSSVKIIGASAFSGTGLTHVDLPDSVQEIGDHSFYSCDNLRYVSIGNSCNKIYYNIFGNKDEGGFSSKAVIYYPDDFKNKEVLKGYSDDFPKDIKILPISEKKEYLKNEENTEGCYIATCVYGSYDCPPVWTLRRYRDYMLSQNFLGRLFIKIYYSISPTIVDLFGNYKWFNQFFGAALDKLVDKLNKDGVENTPYNDK